MEIFFGNTPQGGLVTLGPDDSAHCVRVMRHREGDRVDVIDGSGTLYRCTLVSANPKGAQARVDEEVPGFGSHPYQLTMAVCPTKNSDRFEWFAEKATEIGVDVIAPVIGDRSERKVLKTERLERVVLSAAKQSLKGKLPKINEPMSVKDFIKGAPAGATKLICYCFEGEKHSIPEVLGSSTASEIIILIGPEGDFSGEEADLALQNGWIPVTLGSSRLRTETAAIVATAQVYTVLG